MHNTKKTFTQFIIETAPPDKDIEQWIKSAKDSSWIADFKKRYKKDWKNVLYGRAWTMYNKKHINESIESLNYIGLGSLYHENNLSSDINSGRTKIDFSSIGEGSYLQSMVDKIFIPNYDQYPEDHPLIKNKEAEIRFLIELRYNSSVSQVLKKAYFWDAFYNDHFDIIKTLPNSDFYKKKFSNYSLSRMWSFSVPPPSTNLLFAETLIIKLNGSAVVNRVHIQDRSEDIDEQAKKNIISILGPKINITNKSFF